jgi:hypothetical protein
MALVVLGGCYLESGSRSVVDIVTWIRVCYLFRGDWLVRSDVVPTAWSRNILIYVESTVGRHLTCGRHEENGAAGREMAVLSLARG